MNDYARHVTEDRRLVILRILSDVPGYSSNSSILASVLADAWGHSVPRDQLHTDLAWLAEQGLLEVEPVASVHRAILTARGLDVAAGRATVPGVKRPGPR